MAMLKIAGVTMPASSEYTPGILDLDSEKTTRLANGKMVRDRIAVKRKLELYWSYVTPTELKQILQAVSPPFVEVQYEDPQTGSVKTGTFYSGDRTVSAVSYSGGKVTGWKDLRLSLTEQ